MQKITAELFKKALGRFATGVTVITCVGSNSDYYGFTANSFNSVSINPPLVLFSISLNSKSKKTIVTSKLFAVNLLSDSQQEISKRFGTRSENKFKDLSFGIGKYSNAPLIEGAMCWIECRLEHQYPGGDHAIIVGRVESITINNNDNPLIYYGGNYRLLS